MSEGFRKIILDFYDISEFELLLSLALLFVSFCTIFIYLEIRKIKDQLTLIIRFLALKKKSWKYYKKKTKK